jgi:hypothetical protein
MRTPNPASELTGIQAFLERMKTTLKLELIRKSQEYEFDFEGGRPLNQPKSIDSSQNCGILPTIRWAPISTNNLASPHAKKMLKPPKKPQVIPILEEPEERPSLFLTTNFSGQRAVEVEPTIKHSRWSRLIKPSNLD